MYYFYDNSEIKSTNRRFSLKKLFVIACFLFFLFFYQKKYVLRILLTMKTWRIWKLRTLLCRNKSVCIVCDYYISMRAFLWRYSRNHCSLKPWTFYILNSFRFTRCQLPATAQLSRNALWVTEVRLHGLLLPSKYKDFISLKAGQKLDVFIGPLPLTCHVTPKHTLPVLFNWPAFRLLLFWLDTLADHVSLC